MTKQKPTAEVIAGDIAANRGGGTFSIPGYNLFAEIDASGGVTVSPDYANSWPVMKGNESDFMALLAFLDQERDRIIAEIDADVGIGFLDGSKINDYSDLHDQCDANIYIAGGRSIVDEEYSWSQEKTEQHWAAMVEPGIIGKGIETVDSGWPFNSNCFAGFANAVIEAVNCWIESADFPRSSNASKP